MRFRLVRLTRSVRSSLLLGLHFGVEHEQFWPAAGPGEVAFSGSFPELGFGVVQFRLVHAGAVPSFRVCNDREEWDYAPSRLHAPGTSREVEMPVNSDPLKVNDPGPGVVTYSHVKPLGGSLAKSEVGAKMKIGQIDFRLVPKVKEKLESPPWSFVTHGCWIGKGGKLFA